MCILLALLLIGEYVKYPIDNLDSAWFPINYCVLPQATSHEGLKGLLQKFVDIVC